ncbi:MAG: anhydro-N-acetylmuramic acid kinase [Burkholderiales bacterium]|nr:anhydro-N-acetylmuramic acid kinase [Burkholderiales bacterium]
MSGTSLDGVDGVLVDFSGGFPEIVSHHFIAYPRRLRKDLLDLQHTGEDELSRSAVLSIELSGIYAEVANHLSSNGRVRAIGCHGQTVRHRPDLGYTIQLVNAPLLVELTELTVVHDFRSRDIAAGGQGAPLVPAFHRVTFGHPAIHRAVLNLGGIANITDLPASDPATGYDCGPANMLMDAWIGRHLGFDYDDRGKWASTGRVLPVLLDALLADEYFSLPPPKSTGRDRFNLEWLDSHLSGEERPEDVQATLLELTAATAADSLRETGAEEVYLCGGGAKNLALRARLEKLLPGMKLSETGELGMEAGHIEAAAFAWLARQAIEGLPGNLPEVTGAKGYRILGAICPA